MEKNSAVECVLFCEKFLENNFPKTYCPFCMLDDGIAAVSTAFARHFHFPPEGIRFCLAFDKGLNIPSFEFPSAKERNAFLIESLI